jgi:hypothetical protein
LVVVAHCAAGTYVLPPHTQTQAFTSESITAVIEPLRAKFPRVRHFVVDGASTNTGAIKGMNSFAELAASIEVEDCDAETAKQIERSLAGIRTAVHVLCLGHFVKNRIAEATATFATKPFAVAAEAMAKSLFTADGGTATRRGDLSRFVTAFNQEDRGKALADLKDLMASVNSILTLPSAASYNLRKNTSESLDSGDGLLPKGVTKAHLMATEADAWKASWRDVLKHLQGIDARIGHGSTAANVATVNQTRWLTSAYASFNFMKKNLVPIREFFKTQKNPMAKTVVEALADVASVTADLEEYVTSLTAAAKFLEEYSDSKPGDAFSVYLGFRELMRDSESAAEGSAGRALFDLLDGEMNFTVANPVTPFQKTIVLFFYAALLRPGGAQLCIGDHWYNEAQACNALSAKNFRSSLGFSEAEFPDAEFNTFCDVARALGKEFSNSFR